MANTPKRPRKERALACYNSLDSRNVYEKVDVEFQTRTLRRGENRFQGDHQPDHTGIWEEKIWLSRSKRPVD